MTSPLVRRATLDDLPAITDILNHYILHTHITFDVEPYTPEQRLSWFHEHNDGRRYRVLVACDEGGDVLGYTCSGRFRAKPAYDTTVEVSIGCRHDVRGRGIGTLLYNGLVEALDGEDVHLLVAGIAQPNDASNALHRKLGFREVGVFHEVGRKFGKYWDVLWLEKEMGPAIPQRR